MKKSLGAKIIVGATPVWLVGTYDATGTANIMAAAWAGVCCSEPPCVAVSLRKETYSYNSIIQRKAYTVNVPSARYMREADWAGMASGKDADKFARLNFTPVKGEFVDAPYIKEFSLILECKLLHTIEIGLHTQFIGEIMDVKAEEEILGEKELPQLEKLNQFVFSPGARTYYKTGEFLGKAFSAGKEFGK